MPFNQLILPLLGGYILVTYTNCAVYWSSRQSKEQLLFASAFVGSLLAIVARGIALLVTNFPLGHGTYLAVHSIVNYPGIGTAVLALVLSLGLTWWTNKAWPMADAGFWLYGKDALNQFESLLYMSFSGIAPAPGAIFRSLPVELAHRLFAAIPIIGARMRKRLDERELFQVLSRIDENEKAVPIPLLLTMKDRKVYVGYLEKSPSVAFGNMSHVSILVIKSGYRDKDDLHVTFTEDYSAVFSSDVAKQVALPPCKVIPVSDVASAGLFDIELFKLFQKEHDQRASLTTPRRIHSKFAMRNKRARGAR